MINDKDRTDILNIIIKSDGDFKPSLSSRVNLNEYASKLIDNGVIITNSCNDKINALIGGYNNNEIAYISYLYVDDSTRGQGISKKLLNDFIKTSNVNGNKSIRLTVRKESVAYYLYFSHGFHIINEFEYSDNETLGVMMELLL
ncbi:GNAT family N-acetyltransferase [Photobacterium leiognathi]|uniref:GNAT family N-acetyltransferase n=1 Tax=Photobacterium leiognathi TaxID=553611 RepID=UPI0029823F50|nr:GNAT family N-acetyltransferase [Photobacterium leiognathi]